MNDLLVALFGFVNGDAHIDRLSAVRSLLHDRQSEEMLAVAEMVLKKWKDYLEIRTHPSSYYAAYLFADTFRQEKGIDRPLELTHIKALHEEIVAEWNKPYDDNAEIQIRAKVVARWLGISE